jgi:DNA-binding NtrC family response regulator
MAEWPRQRTHVIEGLGDAQQLVFSKFELKVTGGPDKGAKHVFGQEVVQVGTARGNEVVLTDRTVSRFHLKVETSGGVYTLTDLGSTNGTYLAGHRIQSAYLDDETFIDLGNSRLRFKPLGDHITVDLPNRDRMGGLIGASPRMRQLYGVLGRIADSDLPVVIEGETGTGKELVAHIIHENSPRASQPFEVLDCGAIPDTLIESELFGHVRGAFTGAERERQGIFERAHGGTVFLDELGELKVSLQPKLLRVLETGEIRRVGGSNPIRVDVRVVAATHRSLRELVNRNQFREDLYYRLAGCKVELPPLRDRAEDIPLLVGHFLRALRRAGQRSVPAALDEDTMSSFTGYPWPGNVRQLRNAVERLAVMGAADLTGEQSGPRPTPGISMGAAIRMSLKDAKEAFERKYLEELMARHNGDVKKAAEFAEIHPKSLARLLRRYAIGRS